MVSIFEPESARKAFFGREIFAPRGETEETQPGHTKRRWEPKHMNVEGPLQCPQC